MPLRWGPGPVFVHESIAATRRWQFYALRSLFVLGLLAALGLGVALDAPGGRQARHLGPDQGPRRAREVLLLRDRDHPAHAGAPRRPGRDRRGDLPRPRPGQPDAHARHRPGRRRDRAGQAGRSARPGPGLVAATVPVLALAGLLGGIIFEAILALTLITLALAVLGCTLALAISVRATKTHEVLMAVYGIEVVWVLGPLVWQLLPSSRVLPGIPDWLVGINPFVLAWAPYAWPKYSSVEWLAGVLGGVMAISAGLTSTRCSGSGPR